MDVWRRRPGAAPVPKPPIPSEEASAAATSALALAREINVLLGVANDSRDFHTKTTRLASAKQKLAELQVIVSLHPFMRITSLGEVQTGIAGIESELLEHRVLADGKEAGPENSENANRGPSRMTVDELQDQPLSAWGNSDVIRGLQFSATMQLRTPLRVLLRHGEIHTDGTMAAPQIVRERWEGVWTPALKSFEEVAAGPNRTEEEIQFFKRLDAGLAQPYTVASDIGPILVDDYLPFLIDVRKILEANDNIEHRIKMLHETSFRANWHMFLVKHGGIDGIIERFFPPFMNLAPSLNTPNGIAAASDKALLAIKGIGPAKLKAIRDRCESITTNRNGDRVDLVKT